MEQINTSQSQKLAQSNLSDIILKALSNAQMMDDHQMDQILKPYKVSPSDKMNVINSLITAKRIVLGQNQKGIAQYQFVNEASASLVKGLNEEEYMVYQKISEARDKGITSSELKNKLSQFGFTAISLNKVLKSLEKNGTIKKLKSLLKNQKQVYMLMDIQPSTEVTGGLGGNENFSTEQIEIAQQRVVEYLKSHGYTTYREIALYIKQTGLLNSDSNKDEDMRQLVDLLVFDQKIEPVAGQIDMFKLSGIQYPYKMTYSTIPCAHCPVRHECGPNNVINPQSCEYMQQWKGDLANMF